MLIFEKLVIQGFKSFKRKVSIPFPSGFSCITGPNGSGKTNVLDAVCFVLGRRSPRTLRAKTGKDLIFHGSKVKDGSEYASVTLYFDNSRKLFPMEEKSVTVGRRINQKGVSTYRLNGKVVTREQMVNLFAQVGINPDGHNIIQQGDVNHVVEMDATERRGLLDEISGIAEYDDKKNKAMKELGKVDAELQKAEIILNEKQYYMDKLRRDRDIALQYQKLEKERTKIMGALMWLEQNKNQEGLISINRKLRDRDKEFQSLEKDMNKYEERIAELEKKRETLLKGSLDIKGQLNIAEKVSRLKTEIEMKEKEMGNIGSRIERLKGESERVTTFGGRQSPAMQKILERDGVHGTVSDLVKVPEQFATAVEVAAGAHLRDVVVDNLNVAVSCVKFLKKNKLGRMRFLPMDKVRAANRTRFLPKEAVDWLSNLVKFDGRFGDVMDYVFGSTACVRDIDSAKLIARSNRIRMVTLDGDIFEASGAITGGHYQKKRHSEGNLYTDEIKRAEEESSALQREVLNLKKEFDMYAGQEKKSDKIFAVQKNQAKLDLELEKLRLRRREAYEKRITIQAEIGRFNIEKAKAEARSDNIKSQMDGGETETKEDELKPFIELGNEALRMKQTRAITKMQELGPVNMKALQEFEVLNTEFEEFMEKANKIKDEKNSILNTIEKIEARRFEVFNKTMGEVSGNFKEVYTELTGGDATLELETEGDLSSGLMLRANPAGKKLRNMDNMSGGERTLTAFSFLIAIQRHKPSPFYILDEADAALDKVNTKKVVELIKKQSKDAQFIVISHNDTLVRGADHVFGVSMEDGESKVFGIKLPDNN